MKTLSSLNEMKKMNCPPFENAYEYLICSLEDYYIAKSNGLERIKYELSDWDKEARSAIIEVLIDRIEQSELMDFDPNELRILVSL